MSEEIDKRFDELAKLPAGWDTYDAAPPHPVAIAAAREFTEWAASLDLPKPTICPRPSGGLQVEWYAPIYMEFGFEPDGERDVYIQDVPPCGQSILGAALLVARERCRKAGR